MIARVAPRALLLVLAAAAIVWLYHDLHAVVIDAHGRALARQVLRSPNRSQAQTLRAVMQFDSAASWNADPAPRLDEAQLLLDLGNRRAATQVLNGVVRRNPGDIAGWSLLATAAAAIDPPRAEQAVRQLRALFGHPPRIGPDKGLLLASRGLIEIEPGSLIGNLDSVMVSGRTVELFGWAGLPGPGSGGRQVLTPADEILVVSQGQVIATGVPTLRRQDVERHYRVTRRAVGFRLVLPLATFEPGGRAAQIEVFASLGHLGSQLTLSCGPGIEAFACGR